MAKAGYRVAANCTPGSAEKSAAWAQELKDQGLDVEVFPADVSDFDSCAEMVTAIKEKMGAVEVLVNNAGITRDGMFRKMSKENWDMVMRVDLDSLFNVTRQVVEDMQNAGFGRIINISSLNGQKGQMGQCNYSAAKAGVIGFTKALAQEVARKGVTVNTISPGYIATEMVMAIPEDVRAKITAQIPVGRLGEPDEIARSVLYLAADDNGFITGSNLSINGGQYME
jgi:acetoacetyl-CoA reductase